MRSAWFSNCKCLARVAQLLDDLIQKIHTRSDYAQKTDPELPIGVSLCILLRTSGARIRYQREDSGSSRADSSDGR